jgi:DNA polymerase
MGKFLPNARISEIHGKPVWVRDRLIVPMYHPAAALHQPSLKPVLIADFKALPAAISSARADGRIVTNHAPAIIVEDKHQEDNSEQLSLF